jgi:hypothetical protein
LIVSGLTEIQEAIEKLSKEERAELRQWLEAYEEDGVEESDELMAAIDEGIRSLETEGGISLEVVRQEFLARWGTR